MRGDNLRQAASMHSIVQQMETETAEALSALQNKFETYQSNVKEFVRIRESTHGTISLIFEATETNLSMINEPILAFYLSRIFKLPKEKFTFLHTYQFFEERQVLANRKDS